MTERTVKVTRAERAAAQAIVRRDAARGRVTPGAIIKIANAKPPSANGHTSSNGGSVRSA